MKTKALVVLVAAIILFQLAYLHPSGLAASFSGSYRLLERVGGSAEYRLNVAISQSLQDYYVGKSHGMSSNGDIAKFVTPYALAPIASCLEGIYSDDEGFVNGVLMLVHQVPYEVTVPPKYPVETMVDDKGDCDLFSYVAASVIKAHGLDVVLLYYESESHMNIGVSLSDPPSSARDTAFYVTNNGVRYYVAECTGGNWENGWRVGECPDTLKQASVQVVTLENCEQSSPSQVTASLNTLSASSISLSVSPSSLIQGSAATASGKLSPALQNRTITIYVKTNSLSWTGLAAVTTDSEGRFTYAWVPEAGGIEYVRATWSGDDSHAGADSPTHTITILSTFFVMLLGLVIALVAAGVAIAIISRKLQQGIQAPEPPLIPS
jgi:hypothetical protein